MTTSAYMTGRKQYARPQAMLWSDDAGVLSNGLWVPSGYENGASGNTTGAYDNFIILSDHNRAPINVTPTRIEKRQRMATGRMRSYHIADKLTISTSWSLLPSRSYSNDPNFDSSGKAVPADRVFNGNTIPGTEYTVDGGAGGNELLNWYNTHTGSFFVYLAYDNYNNVGGYGNLGMYNEVVEMFITSFNYSVEKRGGTNMDLWNVSVTLEEV